jgi:hypothetical protein
MDQIEYLRKEIIKQPSEINWDIFIKTCEDLKELLQEESFMGFKKGYVNLIRCSLYDFEKQLCHELGKFPDFLILKVNTQPALLKLIKQGSLTKDLLNQKFVLIFYDRNTVETKLSEHKYPIIKYRYSIQGKYKKEVEKKYHLISRAGGGKIRFQPEDLISMGREHLMNIIFE